MADEHRAATSGATDGMWPDRSMLTKRAIDARIAGEFERAAELFAVAATMTDDLAESLHLQMRGAHCLAAVERFDDATAIARSVAIAARTEDILAERADALGLIADHHITCGRLAEAAHLLAEATYALELLPNEPEMYQVVHNVGVSYARSGFITTALELFDRSLRLADDDADCQFSYSSMTAACHFAALSEPDPLTRRRYLHDGLYAATAALDPQGGAELMATCTARSHRSMMLSAIGHHRAALDDALEARRTTSEHGMHEEQVVAMAGEAIARWHLFHDPAVLDLIADTSALAAEFNADLYLQPMREVEIEILWSLGRFDDARVAMQRNIRVLGDRLHAESTARAEHVQLGVEHLRVAAISEADPLTGLPNRRYLGHWLPEVLNDQSPVCVGVIDLDGFKRVNDHFSYAHGDRVLQELASMLERVCRRGDSVVRLGGDEFVMVLRDASPGDARQVFERIREMIAARRWDGLPSDVQISASVGVTLGTGAFDATQLLATANEALQVAKRSGRDQVIFR